MPEKELKAATKLKDEVLGAKSAVWADGLLEEHEFMECVEKMLGAMCGRPLASSLAPCPCLAFAGLR